jgi:hypothetical protein
VDNDNAMNESCLGYLKEFQKEPQIVFLFFDIFLTPLLNSFMIAHTVRNFKPEIHGLVPINQELVFKYQVISTKREVS